MKLKLVSMQRNADFKKYRLGIAKVKVVRHPASIGEVLIRRKVVSPSVDDVLIKRKARYQKPVAFNE